MKFENWVDKKKKKKVTLFLNNKCNIKSSSYTSFIKGVAHTTAVDTKKKFF